jgi:hypothetical protein
MDGLSAATVKLDDEEEELPLPLLLAELLSLLLLHFSWAGPIGGQCTRSAGSVEF